MNRAAILLLAIIFDHFVGEVNRWHPLVGFGNLTSSLETKLNSPRLRAFYRKAAGAFGVIILVIPFVTLAYFISRLPMTGNVFDIMMMYLCVGHKSLREHAEAVVTSLQSGDLNAARRSVSMIVSRDTSELTETEVSKAAIESVLENGSDGVFAAVFWFMLFGAPGVVLYRLVNTLDAMWGYRNERFEHFGWAAAKLDDILNWLPARLTALSYALLGDTVRSLKCWYYQAPLWYSPNAGPVMAAGAGSLGLELGGAAIYHGKLKERPKLGQGRTPVPKDILSACSLVNKTLWLWIAIALVGGWLHA